MYTLYKFHFLNGISEIKSTFWWYSNYMTSTCVYIYILWRVGCLPLIISISPSLNRRPSPGSRREWVCERGGSLKQPGLAACDEAHLKWMEPHHRRCYMPSAPLLGRPSLPRACTLVSSWVQEGSVEGSSAALVRRLTSQDAGPFKSLEVPRAEGRRSRRPSRPGPQRGARAAAGLRPLPEPFLPEHCPPSQPAQHDEDTESPVYFGHFIPFGHYFIIYV